MSLRSTLRKAAGLIVEFPDEPAPTLPSHVTQHAPSGTSATDTMWAELEKSSTPAHSAPTAGQTPAPAPRQGGPGAAPAQTPRTPAPPQTKTVDQIVRDLAGPNLDQIHVSADSLPNVSNADGTVNFTAIYQSAKLPSVPFTAEQVLQMVEALPVELPLDTKRKTIKVSIDAVGKTIGATPENIVADASRKLAALAAYTEQLSTLTDNNVDAAEKKIAALQAQIDATHKSIADSQLRHERENALCTAESHRLDDILEFFSLDIAPSRHAPDAGP